MPEVEETEVDHYAVVGLPSGEEGAALDLKAIERAYKFKARELHPDKRRDDPDATAAFQRLRSSYELLRDPTARAAFDALLRARRHRLARDSLLDSKRRRLARDLEERERAAAAPAEDPEDRARREEAEASARLKVELARIRAMMRARKAGAPAEAEERKEAGAGSGLEGLEKARVLKVSWERGGGGEYTAGRLREIFAEFGEVEDVVIRSRGTKRKGNALVVMATKEAVVIAAQSLCGDASNPLLVLPLQSTSESEITTEQPKQSVSSSQNLGNIVGSGYQAFEDYVLQKLQKAGEKQN